MGLGPLSDKANISTETEPDVPSLLLNQLANLLLDALVMDRLYLGNDKSFFVHPALPAQDETGHQRIGASTNPTARGIKRGVSHQIQQLPPVKGQPNLLHQDIVPADGSDLLVQILVDVFQASATRRCG
jgi:hypothetical protein